MRPRDEELLVAALVGLVAAFAGGAWAAWWLAARFSGAPAVPDGGPIGIAQALKDGSATWPGAATAWAAALGMALILAITMGVAKFTGRHRTDRAAGKLPRDRAALGRYLNGTGPIIGQLVASGRGGTLRMTTEDQGVVVAGPRTGKTTTVAIPAAVNHDGPLVITSNKRDICDATRGPRTATGRVWIFDPQGIAGVDHPDWWWNPLATCQTVDGARRLAAIWSHTSRAADAKTDAYFDTEGAELLAGLLVAAAKGGHQITRIYQWVQRPEDPEPAQILDEHPDLALMADGLRARQDLPDKQRAGVYGTTQKIISWMADPGIRQWIEPGHATVEFNPAQFALSQDTLISLSREGEGSATPLVTALTANVLRAAELAAIEQPGGRLGTPLLGVLDEAANVCRWKDLPDLYSHYGSRGIVLISIFQSWAQMSEAFTQGGAEKLWSAANVRVYGGGVSDPTFLRRLSELTGEHDAVVWSHSSGRQGYSRSRSTHRRAVLDIATLGALPAGRALAFLSAAPPVMVKLTPWWEGPRAAQIKASLEATGATP